jgi:predicted DNA-binding protein with PD1-like motif
MPTSITGQVGEIILARFDQNEDLYEGLVSVIEERDVRTGVVLSITGGISEARLSYFPKSGPIESTRVEEYEIKGPLEASGHGIIGLGKNGEPYLHVHLTVTNGDGTVCGHLLPGTRVRSIIPRSHFTVMIARIKGAELRHAWFDDRGPWSAFYPEGAPYHELVETPV